VKALSLRQPWAWLVAAGHKDVENRTWATHYRGEFLIHAAKTFDHEGYERVLREMCPALPAPAEFERGGIVGVAELVDCVTQHNSPWFWGPYGFVLRDARPLPFHPLRGMLGFFPVARDWGQAPRP
jgi:hypothetical protein